VLKVEWTTDYTKLIIVLVAFAGFTAVLLSFARKRQPQIPPSPPITISKIGP